MASAKEEATKKAQAKKTAAINEATGGRVLPNNFEAEQAVLGCALIDSEAALMVVSKLSSTDFYNKTHREIFDVIKYLYKQSNTIDFLTVTDELEKREKISAVGGIAYIQNLSNIVPSSASCAHYIDIVKRDSILRQVIDVCGETIAKAYDKNTDENILGVAEKNLSEISQKGYTGELKQIDIPLQEVISRFEAVHKDPTALRGLKTGFYAIDKATNGLQKSDLIIIAARPGVGKTSLAMNIVSNAAINGKAKCAVFSFEMGDMQLAQRMLCSVANVSMAKALRGEFDENDWAKIWKAEKKLASADIYIDENNGNTPSQILSKCRKLQREKGLDLVVIDYIGLMHSDEKAESRQNEVANISRSLKAMAKDLNVPVICLAQLNREVDKQGDNKDGKVRKPVLSDLRESGQIEQDADMVLFIHRDMSAKDYEKQQNKDYMAEIIIAKFRNGQTGSVWLKWDGSRTSFENLEKDSNEQSLADMYQNMQDQKHNKKKSYSPEDFKDSVSSIVNEIEATDLSMLDIPSDIVEDNYDGLEPPEESDDELAGVDFSNVSIPTDDELF